MDKENIIKQKVISEIDGGNYCADTLFARTIFELVENEIPLVGKDYINILDSITAIVSSERDSLQKIQDSNKTLSNFISLGERDIKLRIISRELTMLVGENTKVDLSSMNILQKIERLTTLIANLDYIKAHLFEICQ